MKRTGLVFLLFLVLTASKGIAFSPEALEQVDRSVTFIELQQNPDGYIGRELQLGGAIVTLEARRGGGMQLEIAQLPLTAAGRPDGSFKALGRFLVTIPDDLDRRDYRPGLLVTVIGAVRNAARMVVDGEESVYPVLAVKEMQLWPEPVVERRVPPREVVVYEREPERVYLYDQREPYIWPYYYAPLFPWWFGASITFRDYPSHYYRPHRDGFGPGRHGGSYSGGGGGRPSRRGR